MVGVMKYSQAHLIRYGVIAACRICILSSRLLPCLKLNALGYKLLEHFSAACTAQRCARESSNLAEKRSSLFPIQTPYATRTASSIYFSSISTEILISEVEIIWILMPSSANVRNIVRATP